MARPPSQNACSDASSCPHKTEAETLYEKYSRTVFRIIQAPEVLHVLQKKRKSVFCISISILQRSTRVQTVDVHSFSERQQIDTQKNFISTKSTYLVIEPPIPSRLQLEEEEL